MGDIKKYRIAKVSQESPECRTIRIEPVEGDRPDFKPGQFVMLHLLDEAGGMGDLKRPYSISSSPTEGNYLEITFKVQGVFTNQLAKMKEGDLLVVEGPYGSFIFDESMKDELVFIAGGVGITPFKSMLRYIISKDLPNPVTLFYSSRFYGNLVCMGEFEELKAKKSNFKPVFTLTGKCESDWHGCVGRIDEKMIKENIGSFGKKLFYICGPQPLVNEMIELLSRNGVESGNIRKEEWG